MASTSTLADRGRKALAEMAELIWSRPSSTRGVEASHFSTSVRLTPSAAVRWFVCRRSWERDRSVAPSFVFSMG